MRLLHLSFSPKSCLDLAGSIAGLVRAAIAGQGLALVRDVYAAEEIASGRLALALDRPWPAEFAYYAMTSPDAGRRPAVQDFIGWLKEESKQDEGVAR
ncbi:LysR substrate-binding domain-containing protein [Agrobacterium sp. NPDC058088]|uniref:LysR substrate-binding domain-containing protein n=1 Tax=Agrobacterium sp. NPDC058088 TaxID=3346335 RepID=UPI0036DB882B